MTSSNLWTDGNTVRLSHALIQPIAADAVASTLAAPLLASPSTEPSRSPDQSSSVSMS